MNMRELLLIDAEWWVVVCPNFFPKGINLIYEMCEEWLKPNELFVNMTADERSWYELFIREVIDEAH